MKKLMAILFLASVLYAINCKDLEIEVIQRTAERDVLIEFYTKHTSKIEDNDKNNMIRTITESIGGLILAIVTALNVLNKKKGK